MPITIDGTNGITQADQFNSDSTFGFKNRIINGAMVIDQRNAGASVTVTSTNYSVDRWAAFGSVTSKYTVQQNAGSVTPPVGFRNYMGFTSSSAYTVGASENFRVQQPIEGFNTSDFMWGTANATNATLSFWVRSSLTGTFGGAFVNENADRSYPFTFTISAANTWEYKTITVAGDTSGTWAGATNGIGIRLYFNLGAGSSVSGTANAWQAGFFTAPTGATSVVGTSGATFYITGVQLEVGTVATSFDFRSIGTELALCQRYYWKIARGTNETYGITGNTSAGNAIWSQFGLPVTMRATPTVTIYGTWAVANTGQPTIRGASSTNFLLQIVPTATGIATSYPDSSDDLIDASIEL